MIEDLFAPGRKHTEEERKRLELTRVDLNDGDPGRGPIDLASGKVTVRAPTPPTNSSADPTAPDARTEESDPSGPRVRADGDAPAGENTPPAERAT
ncbi:DUF6191 domain-containing protein [Streptomyces sp. CWNU-52B]|uniref:DUF6191 domain-containing protein n=1 Tax=unclassified Streptomyces TaxID=2593676 RepID=UPI0039C43E29